MPGVAAYNWETSFATSIYHTPLDTPDIVDFDHLERLTRFYAYLLLDADRDPDGILDHGARARQLAKRADALGAVGAPLRAAAEARTATPAAGRPSRRSGARCTASPPPTRPRTRTSRPSPTSPGWRRRSPRSVRTTRGPPRGPSPRSATTRSPSTSRRRRSRATRSASASSTATTRGPRAATSPHSPVLWQELASLRGEKGARAAGPWIGRSLQQHLKRSRAELDRRVGAMARALGSEP